MASILKIHIEEMLIHTNYIFVRNICEKIAKIKEEKEYNECYHLQMVRGNVNSEDENLKIKNFS